ncbi:hypothetical protein DASB73_012050 [Starmerella bacillaris]|uniref:Uncharacterized protein n=1 Tax=Starmerella bacillaris TaxID=1247836 RepID=A0AAV5RGN1_STABA|nr:hypothetical protein DASB73_012050 [Starmerella bacillaris]
MDKYPKVRIDFCTKCKWNLRAAWYAQELLQTFDSQLGEVAMSPADGGVFQVYVQLQSDLEPQLVWDRKEKGFPESKELKQVVRDLVDPARNLGHCEKK